MYIFILPHAHATVVPIAVMQKILIGKKKETKGDKQKKKKEKTNKQKKKREEHNYSVDTAILERQWSACNQRLCVVPFACNCEGHVVHKSVLVWFDSKY